MPFKKSAKKSSPVPPAEVNKNASDPTVASTLAAATKPSTVSVAVPTAAAAATPAKAVAAPTAAAPVAPVVAQAKPAAPSPAAAALIQELRDPSADTAREAALALGKLGEAAAIAPLIEVVSNVDGYYHSVVRAAACASLGQLRDRSATPALLTAVRDSMAEASAEAVRALAALGDERAVEPLSEVLRNEQGFFLPVVRLAAVTALRQFKVPQASAALKALAANNSEDPVLRAAAV